MNLIIKGWIHNPMQSNLKLDKVRREDVVLFIVLFLIGILQILLSVVTTIDGQIGFWFILLILIAMKILNNKKLSFYLFSICFFRNINIVHSLVNLDATYTEQSVSADCTVKFPNQVTETANMNVFDIQKAFAWSVVDLMGFDEVGNLVASGLHFIEAMLLLRDEEGDTSVDEYNQRIQYAFEASWGCTSAYIDNQLQYGRLQSMKTEQSDLKGKIDDVSQAISSMVNKTSDSEKRDQFEGYVSVEINNLADRFKDIELTTDTTNDETPLRCRVYMQELTEAITVINWAYYQYKQASGSAAPKISLFQSNLADVLTHFRDCASFALYDILSNSNGNSLNEFKSELSIIYNGDIFCNWVKFAYENVFYSYSFNGKDFAEWSIDNCNSIKWISHVNGRLMDYDSARFDAYEMRIGEFWRGFSQENSIIYYQRDYEISRSAACDEPFYDRDNDPCDAYYRDSSRNYESCSEHWLSDDDATYSEYNWEYATVQRTDDANAKFIFMGCNTGTSSGKCGYVYSSTMGLHTMSHSCPEGSHFSGGRYLVYDSLWDDGILGIGGLQLSCSNQNDYNDPHEYYNINYMTRFQQMGSDSVDRYYWSPWFICPIGYYLDLQIIAMNGCKDSYKTYYESGGFLPWQWKGQYYRNNELTTLTTNQAVIFKCVNSGIGLGTDTTVSGMIKNYNGLCLTIEGNDNGSGVILSVCDSNLETQQFYLMQNELRNINGKCVESVDLWDINGPLQIMDCDGGDNQHWSEDYFHMDSQSGEARILASNSRCLGLSRSQPVLSICDMDVQTMLPDPDERWSLYQ